MIRIGGYQGGRSVLTRGLDHIVEALSGTMAAQAIEHVPDVTATGLTARSLFDGVESGQWQMAYMASGYLSERVPALGFLDLPLLVSDRADALARLDGRAGRLIGDGVAAATDLRVLGFWDNGFRHITNGIRPIKSPADCSGLSIRTLDSPIYRATLSAMGFKPMFADVRDFAARIASGEIDAQENPLTNVVQFGIHQHHRHVSLTGHVFGVALLVCHAPWFAGLPEAASDALLAACAQATLLQRELAAREDEIALRTLESVGAAVIWPNALDIAGFRLAIQEVAESVLKASPRAVIDAWGA